MAKANAMQDMQETNASCQCIALFQGPWPGLNPTQQTNINMVFCLKDVQGDLSSVKPEIRDMWRWSGVKRGVLCAFWAHMARQFAALGVTLS